MTKGELSLWIEASYPISGRGNPRKPRYGVGINDADYMTTPTVDGAVLCDPAYRAWYSMLQRAYDKKLHDRQQTYSDVTVCKEWHSFSAFRAWWLASYREGWQLDKDLLVVGNKEYGPDVCVYIPSRLNNFTADCGASRGELPIGVSLCKKTGKYQSQCNNPITGKRHGLGRFTTREAAHEAWLRYKLALALEIKPLMDSIDKRIYHNTVTIINSAC